MKPAKHASRRWKSLRARLTKLSKYAKILLLVLTVPALTSCGTFIPAASPVGVDWVGCSAFRALGDGTDIPAEDIAATPDSVWQRLTNLEAKIDRCY
jgi:hypothetical protein